jgi:hypothetical protein
LVNTAGAAISVRTAKGLSDTGVSIGSSMPPYVAHGKNRNGSAAMFANTCLDLRVNIKPHCGAIAFFSIALLLWISCACVLRSLPALKAPCEKPLSEAHASTPPRCCATA